MREKREKNHGENIKAGDGEQGGLKEAEGRDLRSIPSTAVECEKCLQDGGTATQRSTSKLTNTKYVPWLAARLPACKACMVSP